MASSAQEKNVLVDYLFEKALATLGSLEVSNKPSLFLVYAHDNPAHGKAEASTSKYLIDKLSQVRVNLYSDQAPKGEPYSSSLEELKEDGKLEDIVTNQLCLLPTPLRGDVTPVDKVVGIRQLLKMGRLYDVLPGTAGCLFPRSRSVSQSGGLIEKFSRCYP